MYRFLVVVAVLASAVALSNTQAATINNADGEARTVTVTENGVRTEHTVAANASLTVCEKGCFVTFPSGGMLPLNGPEKIVIENGAGRILANQ